MAKDDRKIIIEIIEPSSPPTALNEDGTVETRVAYEVSVGSLEVIEENDNEQETTVESQEAV